MDWNASKYWRYKVNKEIKPILEAYEPPYEIVFQSLVGGSAGDMEKGGKYYAHLTIKKQQRRADRMLRNELESRFPEAIVEESEDYIYFYYPITVVDSVSKGGSVVEKYHKRKRLVRFPMLFRRSGALFVGSLRGSKGNVFVRKVSSFREQAYRNGLRQFVSLVKKLRQQGIYSIFSIPEEEIMVLMELLQQYAPDLSDDTTLDIIEDVLSLPRITTKDVQGIVEDYKERSIGEETLSLEDVKEILGDDFYFTFPEGEPLPWYPYRVDDYVLIWDPDLQVFRVQKQGG